MGRAWGGAIPSRGTRVAVRCSGGSVVDLERHRVWPFQYAHPWLAKRSALSKRTRRNPTLEATTTQSRTGERRVTFVMALTRGSRSACGGESPHEVS